MNFTADSERVSYVRYTVLVWLCLLAMLAYVQRNAISVASDDIQATFELDETDMGWVLSSFFWAYAAAQIPAGWLAKIWGSRYALAMFLLISSVATAVSGAIPLLPIFLTARVVCGFVQAGMFPACADTITRWFPKSQRAMPCGFLASFMSIGGVIAAALTGELLTVMDWRPILVLYAVPGVVWVVWFHSSFRNRPQDHEAVSSGELTWIHESTDAESDSDLDDETSDAERETPWGLILATPAVWFVCGQQFFRAAGYIFYATWFPKYLKEVHHVTTLESGFLASLPLLGVILGSVTGGSFSDWLYSKTNSLVISRKIPGATSQFVCGLLIAVAYFIDSPIVAVCVISLGSFVFSFGSCSAYTVTMDIAGKHVPIVFSIMNMSGNIGAAICPVVVGYLAIEIGWEQVLFFFSGIYIAAGFCWTCIDTSQVVE
ncbi:MAG: MFS transporter [Planctomycetota bacterium]|nr:MFS transporter [Planctomycetota bacterium]